MTGLGVLVGHDGRYGGCPGWEGHRLGVARRAGTATVYRLDRRSFCVQEEGIGAASVDGG
jgi:hypothetical protein